MVTFPKTLKTFCPHGCKKHTKQKVSQYKKAKDRKNGQGTRRYQLKLMGFGGQPKPVFRKNAKITKKVVVKLTCEECKKTTQRYLYRAKIFKMENKKKR